jgi:hypothetical protein
VAAGRELGVVDEGEHGRAALADHDEHEPAPAVGAAVGGLVVDDVAAPGSQNASPASITRSASPSSSKSSRPSST